MEVYIQLSSGKGPKECDFFLTHVFGIFQKDALKNQIEVSVIDVDKNGTDLIQSVVCKLTGKHVDVFLQSWKGSLLWICESPFRTFHKRKNWFIGFFIISKEKEIILMEKDILYQAMRSSGAGGQHVNKVSSAVRALHMPTGITTVAMDTRSQLQNKKLATERLLQKLIQLQIQSAQQDINKQWQNHAEIQRGNPTRVFKGINFNETSLSSNG